MTWQDLNPYLTGDGPNVGVFDASGNPTILLSAAAGGSAQVQWDFTGPAVALLADIQFTVTLYADPIGPPSAVLVDTSVVTPVSPPSAPGPASYNTTIAIAPASLQPDSVYLFTVVITAVEVASGGTTIPLPIAGFFDSELIAVSA